MWDQFHRLFNIITLNFLLRNRKIPAFRNCNTYVLLLHCQHYWHQCLGALRANWNTPDWNRPGGQQVCQELEGGRLFIYQTLVVQCGSGWNIMNFQPNTHNRQPIAGPQGQAMGCLLGVQKFSYLLPLQGSFRLCTQPMRHGVTL